MNYHKQKLPVPAAVIVKILLFLTITFLSINPRPWLFFRQLGHYRNTVSLTNPDFPEMKQINTAIDSLITPEMTKRDEARLVQYWVYRHIPYRYDWYLWKNADYWPDAATVYLRGFEDCDGQAILYASILQARGFKNVHLAGNILHIWVTADSLNMMGAMDEQNLFDQEGKSKINLPSLKLAVQSLTFILEEFPSFRIIIILTALLILLRWQREPASFLIIRLLLLFSGFVLLKDWAAFVNQLDSLRLSVNCIAGIIILLTAYICPVVILKRFLKQSIR